MIEVDHAKSPGDEWKDMLAAKVDLCCSSGMWKDIMESLFPQSQLNIVGVSSKVFKTVQALAKQAKCFCEVLVLAFEESMAIGVESSVMNAALEAVFDECCTCGPITFAVGYVVLHACFWIDLKLDRSDEPTEAFVVFCSVFIISVVLGVATACLQN